MSENQEKKNFEDLKAGYDYNSMQLRVDIEKQNKEKYEQFKERIAQFAEVNTIEEARALSEKILPISQEKNQFKVGFGSCTIINRPDLFRISLDSEEEFISYDFV